MEQTHLIKVKRKSNPFLEIWKRVYKHRDLYILLLPGLFFLLNFKYAPMYGVVIAFQEFNIFDWIKGSESIGTEQFQRLVSSDDFTKVFINTLLISIYKIVILFPIPIIIALLLNEVRKMFFKRTVQTIIYLPQTRLQIVHGIQMF